MKRFLAALQFLTVVPLPAGASPDERALGGSLPFFPVVGLLIGGAAAAADLGLGLLFPTAVASVLTAILLIAASGALHIDGLADTADGLLSSRPRERMLAIMKDSRTGPMGVVAIVCVVALKVALLASVAGPWRFWVVLMLPLAGRCTLLLHLALLPYARPEGGLAAVFLRYRSPRHALWAAAFMMAAGLVCGALPGLVAAAASLAAATLLAAYFRRRLGGLTGDTLGAACELTELVPALIAAAWLHGGAP